MKHALLAAVTAGLLAGCASTDERAKIAQLETELKQTRELLVEVTRRVGMGELVRPTALSLEHGALKGSDTASVVLMEFTDLHCPYCGKFNESVMPELKKEYIDSGKLLFVGHDFPITRIHPQAGQAALALRCASQQGDYAEIKQYLFDNKSVNEAGLQSLETAFELESEAFRACLKNPEVHATINASLKVGRDLGIKSTPSFLVGRQQDGKVVDFEVITGAKDIEAFKAAIDKRL